MTSDMLRLAAPPQRAFSLALILLTFACGRNVGETLCAAGAREINGICTNDLPALDAGISGGGGDDAGAAGSADSGQASSADAGDDDAGLADGGLADGGVTMPIPDAGAATDGGQATTGGADAGDGLSEAVCVGLNPAHTNAQPGDRVASPLTPLWSIDYVPYMYGWGYGIPLVAQGLALIESGAMQSQLSAYDVSTGQQVWGPVLLGSGAEIAIDGDRIFFDDFYGNLSSYSVSDGGLLSSFPANFQIFTASDDPFVATGGLIYTTENGVASSVQAIDEQTGTIRWVAQIDTGSAGPVGVSDGTVYLGGAADEVWAFDSTTGQLIWSRPHLLYGGGGGIPSIFDGLIFATDFGGNAIFDLSGNATPAFLWTNYDAFDKGTIYFTDWPTSPFLFAVDIASRQLKWIFIGDGQLAGAPVVAGGGDGQVFVMSTNGNLYEVDEASGKQISTVNICEGEPPCLGTLIAAANHLFVTRANSVVGF